MTFSIAQALIFYYNFLLEIVCLSRSFKNNTGFLCTFIQLLPIVNIIKKSHSAFSKLQNWHGYSNNNSSADLIQILQVFARGSLRTMHGGGSAPSCCAFTHRVAFEDEGRGMGRLAAPVSGPSSSGGSLTFILLPAALVSSHRGG